MYIFFPSKMRWMFTFSLDTLSSELTVTFSFWCLALLRGILDEDSLKLYTLIWCRTVACQMEPATIEQVRIYSTKVLLFQLMGTSFLYCYCILVNKRKLVQAAILYFSHWKLLFSYEKCTKLFMLAVTKFVEYYINVYIYILFTLIYRVVSHSSKHISTKFFIEIQCEHDASELSIVSILAIHLTTDFCSGIFELFGCVVYHSRIAS